MFNKKNTIISQNAKFGAVFNFPKKCTYNNQKCLVSFFPRGKKCMSPVIASVFLLSLTILAVISFQNWYTSFQNDLGVDKEKETSPNNLAIGIDRIVGSSVYFNAGSGINVNSVKLNNVECTGLNGTYSGTSLIDISTCLQGLNTSRPEVIIVTSRNVFSKNFVLDDLNLLIPVCQTDYSNDVIYDCYNDLYWIRDLGHMGTNQWSVVANSTYSNPIWDNQSATYSWPNGLTQDDYPIFRNCMNLDYGGFNDWRIPTQDEILNLGNEEIGGWGSTNFNNHGFIYSDGWYWGAEQNLGSTGTAVTLGTGSASYSGAVKDGFRRFVCVRED